jgi:hypothetical protein
MAHETFGSTDTGVAPRSKSIGLGPRGVNIGRGDCGSRGAPARGDAGTKGSPSRSFWPEWTIPGRDRGC